MTTQGTSRATFAVGDEFSAKRIVDLLTESFEDPQGRWDVTVHFADPPDEASIRNLVALASDDTVAGSIVFDAIEAKDWVKESLEGLVPVRAGRFIVHGSHDRDKVRDNQLGIEIEAALAFGTGHHGTTRGCLIYLDYVLRSKAPKRILDLGTGTGVLAIAAAKATKTRVLATDIDAMSVKVAHENMWLNGVGNLVETACATGFSSPAIAKHAPFDLILANILANPLRAMATDMERHMASNGMVILSGLLPHQAMSVIAAYRARGLVLLKHQIIEGWSSLLMQRAG
jgi:ribosomal protein L11 methyltransferase